MLKDFDKNTTHCLINVSKIVELQGTYVSIIKTINNKPVANIKLNGEELKAVPPKSGIN